MINKEVLRDNLKVYGMKYWELMNILTLFERKEQPGDAFFTSSVLPGRLFIEPTSRCNKNCVYCARETMDRGCHDSLSLESFSTIIDNIGSGFYITLTGNGEPMLNRHLYEMIQITRSRGIMTAVITNGTLLTEKNSEKLIKSMPNRVQISFDSIKKDVYDLMYNNPQGALSYEKVLEKILKFLHLERVKHKKGIIISITSILTDAVKAVRDINSNYWEQMPIDNYYESPVFSLQTDSNLRELNNDLSEEPWQICPNPWISLKINADGTVNPCCHDFSSKYVVGNVKEQPLNEIYNSKKTVALRKALYYRDISFFEKIGYNCHKCNVWHSDIGHNIKGYLSNSFPIAQGLMVLESEGAKKNWSEKQIAFLEAQLRSLKHDVQHTWFI